MQIDNLWERVANGALKHAAELLKSETAPTAATVETVEKLVRIAVTIDLVDLWWEQQTRSGAAAFLGRPSSRQEEGN